jgi:replication factor C small subunit
MNWLEKYRPRTLNEVFGQTYIKTKLNAIIEEVKAGKSEIPHLFFAGEPGLGKTALAQAFARDVLGEGYQMNFLEMNASDERGIDTVRGDIKNFAKGRPLGSPFKIIYLSEVDNLTQDAQMALRRTMEKWAHQCIFVMSCNRPEKVIDALKDRCMFGTRRFARLRPEEITALCYKVASGEQIPIESEAADYLGQMIYKRYGGSARKAITVLQECSLRKKTDTPVNKDNVKEALNIHKHLYTDEFLKTLLKSGTDNVLLDKVANFVDKLYYDDGIDCYTLLRDLYDAIIDHPEINIVVKRRFAAEVGDTLYKMSNCDDQILLFKSWLRWVPYVITK